MLRDALVSVERQTRLDSIEKVVVSENGGNRDSEAICNQFSSLPIEYLYWERPVSVLDHWKMLFGSVETPFLALLHDDDWWLPDHLENSLISLEKRTCIAVFSNCYEALSMRHPLVASHLAARIWVATGFDFARDQIDMKPEQNVLVCLLAASYHYSTYVGRTRECRTAWEKIIQTGNTFDSDRTFPVFLGGLGAIVYVPKFGAVIRLHPEQDSRRELYLKTWGSLLAATTQWLFAVYPEMVSESRHLFNDIVIPGLTEQELEQLISYLPPEQIDALYETCGFMIPSYLRPAEHAEIQSPCSLMVRVWKRIVFALKCRTRKLFMTPKKAD